MAILNRGYIQLDFWEDMSRIDWCQIASTNEGFVVWHQSIYDMGLLGTKFFCSWTKSFYILRKTRENSIKASVNNIQLQNWWQPVTFSLLTFIISSHFFNIFFHYRKWNLHCVEKWWSRSIEDAVRQKNWKKSSCISIWWWSEPNRSAWSSLSWTNRYHQMVPWHP